MLIKVIAAGVNPVDAMIRSGMFSKTKKLTGPLIPGGDIAGIVEKTGSSVTKFKPGDQVYAYVSLKDNGGYAEYALTTERKRHSSRNPFRTSKPRRSRSSPYTAWQAMFDKAKLSAGQTILIHGGSGGVGTFAIQLPRRAARKS